MPIRSKNQYGPIKCSKQPKLGITFFSKIISGKRRKVCKRVCLSCKADFLAIKFMVEKGLGNFCSRRCVAMVRDNSKFLNSAKRTDEKHHSWKGGINLKNGYRTLKVKTGLYIFEHRLIMENTIGRKLFGNEIVHHLDGNKLNNSKDNLVLINNSEHTRLHNSCRKHNFWKEIK